MTRRRRTQGFALARICCPGAVAAALGCAPVPANPPLLDPGNSCPLHPCEQYVHGGALPQCVSGVCLAPGGAGPLVLLVSMPSDGFFAPGSIFPVAYDGAIMASDAGPDGAQPTLVLPSSVGFNDVDYKVTPAAAAEVSVNLFTDSDTSLPFHATLQPISLSDSNATPLPMAGLPLEAIHPQPFQTTMGDSHGPGYGPATLFSTVLAPGTYDCTFVPDPPFDQAFGPLEQVLVLPRDLNPDRGTVVGYYDSTGGPSNPVFPTFTIVRADQGSLDGWTAYLRDINTKVAISNVVPLAGAMVEAKFAVRRVPQGVALDALAGDPDALQQAALAIAPPPGAAAATCIYTPINNVLTSILAYPATPPPVAYSFSIGSPDGGTPGPVDLVFEQIAITLEGNDFNSRQCEFTQSVAAIESPSGGPAAASVLLPPGLYRVDLRPGLGLWASEVQELSVAAQDAGADDASVSVSYNLSPPLVVRGAVQIADGRPLSGATIQAIPKGCPQLALLQAPGPTSLSNPVTPWCMPRPAQAIADPAGSYALALDPGQFDFRAMPPGGSLLPWVEQPWPSPDAPDGGVPILSVPAPMSIGLRVTDPAGNPIPNALVRAFRDGGQGAVEVGDAITDGTGVYQMFIAPP